MLLHPNTLKVAKAASADDTRYTLNGVHIEPDGSAVATDGKQLLKWTPADTPAAEDYPAIEGFKAHSDGIALQAFILPSAAAAEILKAVPKKSMLPVLENIALDVEASNDNGSAAFAVTDLENPRIFRPKKIEGDYPDYNKVIPPADKTPVFEVSLGLDTLLKSLNAIKALYPKGINGHLKFKFYGPVDAIRIEGDTGNGEITAVIMPLSK